MKTIEQALIAAANAGELTYLSVVPRAGKGGIVFSVMYRGASEGIKGHAEDADPTKAILAALGQTLTPTGRKRRTGRPASDAAISEALGVNEMDFG